jgi:nucleotidyltransferase/DNA polymerase involved in DNA repair
MSTVRPPGVVCLYIPNLPIQIELNRQKSTSPIIIPDPIAHDKVFVVSRKVFQAGVQIGMPLRDARRKFPSVKIANPDKDEYYKQHNKIYKAINAFTSIIETIALGEFAFYAYGSKNLHTDEASMAAILIEYIKRITGLGVQVGIGNGKFISQAAARKAPSNDVHIVTSGNEAKYVSSLRINNVPYAPEEVTQLLTLLGIKTLGQLASLNESAVLSQFGIEILPLYELAQGNDWRPLINSILPRSEYQNISQITLDEVIMVEKWAKFEGSHQWLIHQFGESALQSASSIQHPPPIKAQITVSPSGQPKTIVLAGQMRHIKAIKQMWRVERNWWEAVPVRRDYYKIVLSDGSERDIFIDLNDGQWYRDRARPLQ